VFVAKAGYDPREVILFWKKFASLSNVNSIGEFFSTHPMSEKRMEEMRKELPEVLKTYEKASVRRGKGEVYR
jgi:predicted Zn-dependent protease